MHRTFGTRRPNLQSPTACLASSGKQVEVPLPAPKHSSQVVLTTSPRLCRLVSVPHPVPARLQTSSLQIRALDRSRGSAKWLLRKEVIQPHLPVRLPCYDLVLIVGPTFDGSLPQGVGPPASGVTDFHDLTGGVYKARERIHRSVADLRLLATPTSWGRVADPNPN